MLQSGGDEEEKEEEKGTAKSLCEKNRRVNTRRAAQFQREIHKKNNNTKAIRRNETRNSNYRFENEIEQLLVGKFSTEREEAKYLINFQTSYIYMSQKNSKKYNKI